MSVNNGRRVEVELSDFSGIAGLVEDEGGTARLAYTPAKGHGNRATRPGTVVTIDGKPWEVTAVDTSKFIKTMRVLTLKAG